MYIQTLGDFGEYKTKTFLESTQNFVTFLYYLRPQSDLNITQNKVEEKKSVRNCILGYFTQC